MTQTCSRCSRVNPVEAFYCYFDGMVLPGHGSQAGPMAVGRQPFPVPFVFPSGHSCRSFDELALAIQGDWSAGRQALEAGQLGAFFGSIGRADLGTAAQEALRYPDRDRGLDQLLGKLPTDTLEPPKLRVGLTDFTLGVLAAGKDRSFDLELENQGMRLLYGSASVGDSVWLALGEAPGAPEKLFDFNDHLVIPVHVRGKHLRAGNKPLEGRIFVETNGGTQVVVVRAEVPIKPFPDGVLAGAKTPRQIAEKAKAQPKEAAALFENGAVANWYRDNGWTYPVQGPAAVGFAAVQQFFEALGLSQPPKVDINTRAISLFGDAGASLEHTVELSTAEKRAVYGHGKSNQPWLEVGRARLSGRTATVPLVVSSVPDRPGETLTAKVAIIANGNQKFLIPVTLTVGAGSPRPPAPVAVEPAPASFAFTEAPTAMPQPAAPAYAVPPIPAPPVPVAAPGFGRHAIAGALLGLALLCVVVWDLVLGAPRDAAGGGGATSSREYDLLDPKPRLQIHHTEESMRFGLSLADVTDPASGRPLRLTYYETGNTNNTIVRVGGYDYYYGKRPPGNWPDRGRKKKVLLSPPRVGMESLMTWEEGQVAVHQIVELVPGGQSRLLDTCLVRYVVHNTSQANHKVALRVMLDTFIGANDGVPFAVPGQPGLLTSTRQFGQDTMPDFIQALERDELSDPGTVAHLGLKGISMEGLELEPIERLVVCRWPENSEAPWEWRFEAIDKVGKKKDSCVVLYWGERNMAPGEKRVLGFTYGLNSVSTVEGGSSKLGLTVGGSFRPGGEFSVTAYVTDAVAGQKVRLTLPQGLTLLSPTEEHEIAEGGEGKRSQVSWRVRGEKLGDYVLSVSSGLGAAKQRVRIRPSGLFN